MNDQYECRNGHQMTDENTYDAPDGIARCRTCRRDQKRRQRERELKTARKAAAVPVTIARIPVGDDWRSYGVCAETDPEAFFPDKGGSTRDAKELCAVCEVRAICLAYALENDERHGIWGGLSESERKQLRRKKSA